MFSLSRDQKIRSLERFLFKNTLNEKAAAENMTHIIGVLIGVKKGMEGDFAAENVDSRVLKRFEKLLTSLGLVVIFERNNLGDFSYLRYFVSTSDKRVHELQDLFLKSNCSNDPAIHAEIGRFLGYPETAIYNFTHYDKFTDERQERLDRNRFYAHSAAHEAEEFEAYEVPIYKYIVKHCPKTAKVLKSESSKRWLD